MVKPELLLMRHGAGVKPGQDPAKVPPGPDRVLTAEGYRDAQAVGHVLAEILGWRSADGRRLVVRYPGRPAAPATAAPGCWWRWAADSASRVLGGEPEATARVIVRQLGQAGIDVGGTRAVGVYPAGTDPGHRSRPERHRRSRG
jgi:hypothetical protein